NDQNGVLGGKSDGRQESHFEINIVWQTAQHDGQERAQNSKRHHKNDRQRNRPAFIKRGQAEKHDQQRERVKHRRLRAGQTLFVGLASPFQADSRRQLSHHFFHGVHRLTGAFSGNGRADEFVGRRSIVVLHLR